MAATNIEQGKNFVIHTPGFFGYFDGFGQLPFDVTINKPDSLYGSTSLTAVKQTSKQDVFKVNNVDVLYDSPIMYSVPDTTTINVGTSKVLVSVYSPGKQIHSKEIAGWMSDLLEAARKYLGGKLPAEKYAFLYYFKDAQLTHSFPAGLGGALEHTTSSFYYLPDAPAAALKPNIVNISSHEFFHIITPLTIASKEIKEFNYDEPVLSKHLWLYEGVTEYTAHHVQVKYGLISNRQFLDILSEKITNSRTSYNDTLSFTEMSKEAAGKYEKEYGNVYEKGALIGACLDLLLLDLSDGNYGLKNLTHDLGVRYGSKKFFNDDELIDVIGELSYPQAAAFLRKYVQGTSAIPYNEYFKLAGVKFTPKLENKVFSIGGIYPAQTQSGAIVIHPASRFNDFGEAVGFKAMDQLFSLNGVILNTTNSQYVIDSIKNAMKEGEMFEAMVGRKNEKGVIDTILLKTIVFKATEVTLNTLELMPDASAHQNLVQQSWLKPAIVESNVSVKAIPTDVSSIDAIVNSLYNVISGPAGDRNWERFNSLFLPEATMGAASQTPKGNQFKTFTPAEYQRNNAPFFMQSAFYESEMKRIVTQFGNIASVESSYQYKTEADGPAKQKGINYITLVNADGRWWIANLSWHAESEANKLPANMLAK